MKCDATISYNEIMETGGIVLRRCPITNGVETRMTEAGFKEICTATRKRTNVFSFSGNSTKQTVAKKSFCSECRGKIRPAELIIITQEEIRQMTAIKKGPGECAICGRNTTVFTNHDQLTCTNCAAVQAALGRRPAAVAEIITQLGKASEIVGMLGGQVGAAGSVSTDRGLAAELMEHIQERYNLESITLIPSFIDNLDRELGDSKRRAHAAKQVIATIRDLLDLDSDESIIETVVKLQRERQQATDIWFEVCGILNIGPANMLSLPGVVREMVKEINDLKSVEVEALPEQPKSRKPDAEALLETALDCLRGWPISQERMAWLIEEAFGRADK